MITRVIANFVLTLLTIAVIVTSRSRSEFTNTRDAQIDQLLKKLNKPAIKSIKLRPSFIPKGYNNESSDTEKHSKVAQLWTINGKCPKNSLPLRRIRREDILRAKSIEKYGKKDPNSIPQPKPRNSISNTIHEYAQIKVDGKFHGAKADINVWKPFIQTPKEFSLAQMWILAGPYSEINSVEAGWQVYPARYGDDNPRFFIFWTADGYQSGCYNVDCPGFVPINQEFVLGATIKDVSTLNGQQYHITTTIWKDPGTGNWWLRLNENLIVGYWPSILFNHLQNGATEIQWGGEIVNFNDASQHTTTKMGSGRFAEEGYQKASYFKNLEIVDEKEISKPPKGGYSYMTQESCYNVRSGYDTKWGINFFLWRSWSKS